MASQSAQGILSGNRKTTLVIPGPKGFRAGERPRSPSGVFELQLRKQVQLPLPETMHRSSVELQSTARGSLSNLTMTSHRHCSAKQLCLPFYCQFWDFRCCGDAAFPHLN